MIQPFLDITKNPSWEIARRLPATLAHNDTTIQIIVPEEAMPAAYHTIFETAPKLIQEHDPDIVVHMGLAIDRDYFAVEKSALKEGYHDIPDVRRKVFTRGENKKAFAKSPASLETSLDLESAVATWSSNLQGVSLPLTGAEPGASKVKGKQKGKLVDVRLSDDVGTYVCGFVYYVSMLEMQKRGKKKDVVFLHVPRLDSEEEVSVGLRITEELIKSLVDAWNDR